MQTVSLLLNSQKYVIREQKTALAWSSEFLNETIIKNALNKFYAYVCVTVYVGCWVGEGWGPTNSALANYNYVHNFQTGIECTYIDITYNIL